MSPGGEAVRRAREDCQINVITSFATGKERMGEAKQ